MEIIHEALLPMFLAVYLILGVMKISHFPFDESKRQPSHIYLSEMKSIQLNICCFTLVSFRLMALHSSLFLLGTDAFGMHPIPMTPQITFERMLFCSQYAFGVAQTYVHANAQILFLIQFRFFVSHIFSCRE